MKRGVWLVGAVAMAAATVLAQGGGGGGGRFGGFGGGPFGGMNQTISTRDLTRYEDFLQLTPEQRDMVKTLHDGYTEQANAQNDSLREKMDKVRAEFQDTRDPSVWQGLQGTMEEARASRKKMDAAFLDDVKAVLTADQSARFPQLERLIRRDRMLPRGLMSGERVNVVELAEQAELPAEVKAQADPVLEQYQEELDRALVKRTEVTEDTMRQAGVLFRDGDMEKAEALLDKAREAAVAVRDVNTKYARQIEGMLPDDKKAAWQDAVRRASFPQIYRPTQASRALEAAAGFADLDDTQKTGIAALQASYTRDSAGVNLRLGEAQQKAEETMSVMEIMRRGRGQDDGPLGDLRRERRDLDRTTLDNLKKILRPEQVERLPSNEDRGGPGAGNRQGGGPDEGQGGGRRRGGGGQDGGRPGGQGGRRGGGGIG
ncbi:MAG: hypothetical protein IT437_05280 [Phycisphaerales bacterium]|nr:hypothetical protein [Phycisphaerales bacterium]